MTGELILTSYTFDQGRTAINNSFSGSADFAIVSATTYYSGTTNLYNIFSSSGSGVGTITPGSNITTGGTIFDTTVSTVASPSFNNITVSGSSNLTSITATTISSNQLYSTIYSATTGVTYYPNFNDGSVQQITLSGNVDLKTATNVKSGARYSFILVQDAIGGRTITWQTTGYFFPNGAEVTPVLYSGASSINLYNFVCNGTVLLYESHTTNLQGIP